MLKVEILDKMKQDYIDELGHPQEKKGLHTKNQFCIEISCSLLANNNTSHPFYYHDYVRRSCWDSTATVIGSSGLQYTKYHTMSGQEQSV